MRSALSFTLHRKHGRQKFLDTRAEMCYNIPVREVTLMWLAPEQFYLICKKKPPLGVGVRRWLFLCAEPAYEHTQDITQEIGSCLDVRRTYKHNMYQLAKLFEQYRYHAQVLHLPSQSLRHFIGNCFGSGK